MKKMVWGLMRGWVVVWCLVGIPGVAFGNTELIETGRLLAKLLDAGRMIIDQNQAVINDPSRGDKGFTPEVFEAQVMTFFQKETGVDLHRLQSADVPGPAKALLMRLLSVSKETVASYQTVINIPGVKYKGLIPATFGTEAAKRFRNWSKIYLKQTAPDHFLRNPQNKADGYEAEVMKVFADSPPRDRQAIYSKTIDEERSVRVLMPLYYEKSCLSCHGGPKGEKDISGYTKEGGHEGELAGAISVKLPLP
ncbi:MAG: histidine kinase [Nitrospirales bacterium]|nr:MAG: histidine kinase [Nitrospirales bacterium]